MPSNRKTVLANGEYYHIYNRGVEKRPVFTNRFEYLRAIDSINFYRYGELLLRYSKYLNLSKDNKSSFLKSLNKSRLQIEIVAFCLMGNHFHFLVKQLQDNGIVKFMAKFQNSYTKYFNTKHKRVGPLFQGVFKSVRVEDDKQLVHLSRYIHLNPVLSFDIHSEGLKHYQWSSYPDFLGIINTQIVNPEVVLDLFKSRADYEKFVLDQIDYAKQLEMIKHLSID